MIRHIIFAIALFACVPAFAAAKIDQAGADALKPRIADSLASVAASFSQSGITMQQTGSLLVEPAGDYYAVTTPNITLALPNGVTRTVGMVAINAIPTDNADVFKVAVALPTPMIDTRDGKTVGALEIGTQSMNGIWNLAALAFLQLDADYKNIRQNDQTRNTLTTVPELTIDTKLTPNGTLYSGPLEMVFTGMSRTEPKLSWSAATVRARIMLHDVDLKIANDAKKAVAGGNAANINAAMIAYFTKAIDRADIFLDEQDVKYKTTNTDGTVAERTFKTLTARASLTKIKSGFADGKMNVTVEGIATSDPKQVQFTPTRANFNGTIERFPVAGFFAATDRAAMETAFNNAKTRVVFENSVMEAPAYHMSMNADVTASAKSKLGVGKYHMEVRGIDQLIAHLNSPQGAQSLGLGGGAVTNLVPLLAVVQLTGHSTKDAQGRDIRTYDLVLKEDGRIILNGNDMTAITSTLQQAANGAKAQGPLAPVIVTPPKK